MATATFTPFEVVADRAGGNKALRCMLERFVHNRGPDLVAEFLNRAGYVHGRWVLKVFDVFKAAGRTPPIQLRHVDERNKGIVVMAKPGANDTGTRCTLLPPPDLNLHDVYDKLAQTLIREKIESADEPETVDHVELVLDNEMTHLILMAVAECHTDGGPWKDINEFASEVATRMATEDADVAYYMEALEQLVERGLLTSRRQLYHLTQEGETVLHVTPKVEEPPKPVTPPREEVPPAPPLDTLELLIKIGDRLQLIQEIPLRVASTRNVEKQAADRVQALKTQIGKLQGELTQEQCKLDKAKQEIKELVGRVDAKTLQALTLLVS